MYTNTKKKISRRTFYSKLIVYYPANVWTWRTKKQKDEIF